MRQLFRSVLDSPVAEADLREVFAGWRVAAWVSLLAASVAVVSAIVAGSYFSGERPFPMLVARHGIGALLVSCVQGTAIAFLTLAVPFRASGLLEGPRWRGYFDQVVASGVAPWRYFAGRALASQALVALVLAAQVPALLVFWLVDPCDLAPVLTGAFLTVVWAELLLAVTLGLSVLVHEALAVPGTILLAVVVGFFGMFAAPTALVAICPLRYVIGPLAPALTFPEADPTYVEALFGAPRPFGVTVPHVPYAVGLSAVFALLAAVPCVFGPVWAFLPGFNNFGAVVLPGDSTRAAFRRVRPVLQRRVELAFFFENRGPRLSRLAPWARVLQISLFLFVVGFTFVAAFANMSFATQVMGPRVDDGELAALVPMSLAAVLVLGPLLFATSKNDAHLGLRLGPLEVPLPVADLAAYALVLAALGVVLSASLEAMLPNVALRRAKTPAEALAAAREWIAILSVVSFTALLIAKSIGLRAHARAGAGFLGIAAVGLTCFAIAVLDTLHDRDGRIPRTEAENARIVAAVHVAWPLRMVLAINEQKIGSIRLPAKGAWRWLAMNGFWVLYPAFDAAQLATILTLVRRRRAEARRDLEAIRAGAAQ